MSKMGSSFSESTDGFVLPVAWSCKVFRCAKMRMIPSMVSVDIPEISVAERALLAVKARLFIH